MNRQGGDDGTQYRSVIFYHDEAQRDAAQQIIKELTDEKVFRSPIVTELSPLKAFYPAEDYHREYYKRNSSKPYCQVVIAPKLSKFRAHFQTKLKKQVASQRA